MLLIWGTRRTVQTLLMLTMLCGRCGNPAAHTVKRLVTKFTFFFIPLFPISTRHLTQCTFCGHSKHVTKEEVAQMQLSQQPSVEQYPQPGMPAPAPQSGAQPALPPGQPAPQPGYPQGNGMPMPAPQSGGLPAAAPQPGMPQPGMPMAYPQSGGMPVQPGMPGQQYPQDGAQQYPPQAPPTAR